MTRAELLALDISGSEIKRRVQKGLLIREYRGVYRVGHAAPSYEASYLAAVKACGPAAVLYGRAAAYDLRLLPLTRKPPPAEVMCPTERSVPGVKTRRCRKIDRREISIHDGIPTTTVPRTLLDLAAEDGDEDELVRACHEATVRWRIKPSHVQAVLDRHPRAKGSRRLRRVMLGASSVQLSELERGFRRALERAGLRPTSRSAVTTSTAAGATRR